jgi:ABC-type multidrug transport system ATPase subunit
MFRPREGGPSEVRESASESLRAKLGFVDQEDNLLGTMTVFESVMFSAVLRLPDDMSLGQKAQRVADVLEDLRIQHVADSFIGYQGHRWA